MDAVYRHLVRHDAALVQLLTPPFDRSTPYPGYIRGYVPGVRENGGQYTHGAIWAVMAFAALGETARAWELMSMINPVNHASDPEKIAVYRVEPYVVAADVYAMPPHTGRGGWTWYTGSAGWMYRLIVESLLGIELAGDKLRISPRLPPAWKGFKFQYRHGEATFDVTVSQSADAGAAGVWVDGTLQSDNTIPLAGNRAAHSVQVRVAPASDA